ncbi:MAG: response regulator transcription factor [Verrucomicrobiaceae bacterium]|nr:response regulator transcription factor [Verrucomicrobiaceae bacterium]
MDHTSRTRPVKGLSNETPQPQIGGILSQPGVPRRRIFVVDHCPLLRHGLARLIESDAGLELCGEADCVSTADTLMRVEKPHLILLDLHLGNGDALHFIKSVRTFHAGVRVLVMSEHDDLSMVERCLRAGADGYITKCVPVAEVIEAMHCVLEGQNYLTRPVAVAMLGKTAFKRKSRPENGVEALTDRELHVFQLVGRGLGTSRIAKELGVSPKTIEAHREHIKMKIGAANAQELVAAASAWVKAGYIATAV